MIHTVTLNPTLDITYVLEEFSFGEPVKALSVAKSPGGKGVNVSRALRAMDIDSVVIGLIGGYIGEEVLYLLEKEGLILQVVRIKNETRANVIILSQDDERQLMIRSAGPPVEVAETQDICNWIYKITTGPEILVLSGSLPPGVKDDIYYSLIKEGKAEGTRFILDAAGEALAEGIEAGPFMIKPNRVELEGLAGRELPDDDSIIGFCSELFDKGVSTVLVSLGGDGALLVSESEVLRGLVPRVSGDTVGAGDSTVAGFLMGMVGESPIEECFKMGLACGVSAVMHEGPGLCEPKTYGQALSRVKVERIG